jgi:cytochrome c-type biogenesis protein CcmH/NrfF
VGSGVDFAEPDGVMRILWWVPVTLAAVGAGVWLHIRRKRRDVSIGAGTPVSEQWLAQARGREDQHW